MVSLGPNGVHAISFVCIAIALLGVNAIYIGYNHPLTDTQVLWIGIVDVVAFAGLSYYGANIVANASGVTVTTTPTTTTTTTKS